MDDSWRGIGKMDLKRGFSLPIATHRQPARPADRPNLLDRNFTVTPLGYLLASPHMLVVAGHAEPKHMALHPDRPYPLVALDEGVPHFCPLAKYAIAFPRMSRSMVNRP
jgi:hypothetical protein